MPRLTTDHIFISFAHDHRREVEQVRRMLHWLGDKCAVVWFDDNITIRESRSRWSFAQSIKDLIASSETLVMLTKPTPEVDLTHYYSTVTPGNHDLLHGDECAHAPCSRWLYGEFIAELTPFLEPGPAHTGIRRLRRRIQNAKHRAQKDETNLNLIGPHCMEDGFSLERYLSLSNDVKLTLTRDLKRLGPPAVLITEAVNFVFDHLAVGDVGGERLPERTYDMYQWVRWLAGTLHVDLEIRPLSVLPACLIQTPDSTAIYLAEHLAPHEMASSILHELGHLLLRHTANTEYGLDPARIPTELRHRQFERQEREADALGGLVAHIFEGLIAFCQTESRQQAPAHKQRKVTAA